jgi:ferredoxin-NADP reductase
MTVGRDFTGPALPPWPADDGSPLRCVQVRQESHDVKTFVLQAEGGLGFSYLPGQFVTLALPIDGQTVHRCYTLSSSPTRPDLAAITVKRVPGGRVSNWLHERLRVGDTLAATGPAGMFSCFSEQSRQADRYLFLSGGSGVTPLMSMTRALHDLASTADVVFVHCARSPADVLFADELAMMARQMPMLRLATVCEQQPLRSAYAGHLGRLDAALLARIVPDLATRDTYNCGPAPFMAVVRGLLADAGYDLRRYREESFAFAPAPAAPEPNPATQPAAPAEVFRIRLGKTGTEFSCRSDQSILQAAVAQGLRLPSSCSSGVCGTCKTRKLSGAVDMKHAGGIRQREIDQGWILPCCSRPLSDVELER